ncbi:MAG: HWE histidine kinase domain-containing protein [Sphingobium sp.]
MPDPAIQAAIDAYARGLNAGDPMQIGFQMTPVAMVVSDPTLPDCPLIYVNAAFEKLTGFAAIEVLGRNCRFMQGSLTEEADVARLKSAIERCEPIELDLLNHRRDGTPFWNRLMVAPVFHGNGAPRYFVASQIDVTIERHRVRELEQDREALAAEVAQRDADLVAHNARLRLALKAGALGTWTLDLSELTLTASSGCKSVFGRPLEEPFTYEDLLSTIHPEDLPRMQAAVARTIEHGEHYHIEYRILTPAGEQRWVAVQGELSHRADGTPLAMTGFSTDISQRKFAEEHRAVLARELTHRVKNTLATVNAVASQTIRRAASLEEAATTVSARIANLGAAQELLIRDEVEGAAIGDIVERALLPFTDDDGARFAISGPHVRLSPEITLGLAMALHELATNAVKYGALSVPEGQVAIQWSISTQKGKRRLVFSWIEQGGPPVTPPTRTGFGTRMIERMLSRHVHGGAVIRYPQGGACFEIEAAI